jgi:hypothetical protein
MKLLNSYPSKFLLGKNNEENIYLSVPSFDCNWGFGYIGNKNTHYHLYSLMKETDLYNGLKKHFGDTLTIKEENLYEFCEIVKTIYSLKETAEVFGRGGSHYTTNPLKGLIIDKDLVNKINGKLIPELIDYMYKILV